MSRSLAASAILARVFLPCAVAAAEPELKHLYPVAAMRGTTVAVVAAGKFEPWPPQVWVDGAGVTFRAGDKPGKFDVEIARDAPPGPRLVRFYNESGASAPRFFIVSNEPELLEVEPNDHFQSPQKIAGLPVTVSGRLEKAGDVDSFAVALKRGESLAARLDAYVLGSTMDGMLRITDARGVVLAFNHDGRTPDPLLDWRAPSDGEFVVQVMGFAYPATSDVRLTGGEGCVYRLHLVAGGRMPSCNVGIEEKEPNDARDQAQVMQIPTMVTGGIGRPGDEDRWTFRRRKGVCMSSGSRRRAPDRRSTLG